jgi:hypothetical protein
MSESEISDKRQSLIARLFELIKEFQDDTECAVLNVTVKNNDERFGAPELLLVDVEIEVDAGDTARAVATE